MNRRHPLLLLLLFSACPTPARAGLYNPCELDEGPYTETYYDPTSGRGFRDTLLKVRSYSLEGIQRDNPFRQRYLLVGEALRTDPAKLSLAQKIALSEYQIRRRRFLDARLLLRPLAKEARDNFFVHSNLATACFHLAENQQGDFQEAIDHLETGLKAWPKTWEALSDSQRKFLEDMYWNQENFTRCRTAEEYFMKLLKSRQREALRKETPETVDPLFAGADGTPIRYVGEGKSFEPGKLAAAELAKLPEKNVGRALQIVQQLLVWMPMDTRLYWQLGELYAARGKPQDLRAARMIFDDLVTNMNLRQKELKERRLELLQLEIPEESQELPADVLNKIGPKVPGGQNGGNTNSPDFNWRTLLIGLVAGALVALFAQWQIREILRRRPQRKSG